MKGKWLLVLKNGRAGIGEKVRLDLIYELRQEKKNNDILQYITWAITNIQC